MAGWICAEWKPCVVPSLVTLMLRASSAAMPANT